MAIVNSLVCWGGRIGKTVTISIASPAVLTLTNHGLREGVGIVFSTTGVLPTGITAGATYYPKSTSTNTFNLYDTYANALAGGATGRISTSGAQSGTHTAKSDLIINPVTRLADYGLAGLSRWGEPGSERIYDGITSWVAARSSLASGRDLEFCEIVEAFDERTAGGSALVKSAKTYICTKIDGKRTAAFHAGNLSGGYCIIGTGGTIFYPASPCEVDGLRTSSGASAHGAIVTYPNCTFKNNIFAAFVSGAFGIIVQAQGTVLVNNLVYGYGTGIRIDQGMRNSQIANNTITKCNTGVFPVVTSNIAGSFVNNISIGNTTNWSTVMMSSLEYSSGNAGLSTDAPWMSSGETTLAITTDAFVDWANNDFRPASGSPLIDAGVSYYNAPSSDLAGADRPSYAGGAAEYADVGAFEFDKGYGPRPESHVLTLDNVVVGSRIVIRNQAKTVTHYNEIATSSTVSITVTVYGDARDNWLVDVRKASAAPFYQRYKTLMTVAAGTSSHYVNQLPDQR